MQGSLHQAPVAHCKVAALPGHVAGEKATLVATKMSFKTSFFPSW